MYFVGHKTGEGRTLYWMKKRTKAFDYSFDVEDARCFKEEDLEETRKIRNRKGYEYLNDELIIPSKDFKLTP